VPWWAASAATFHRPEGWLLITLVVARTRLLPIRVRRCYPGVAVSGAAETRSEELLPSAPAFTPPEGDDSTSASRCAGFPPKRSAPLARGDRSVPKDRPFQARRGIALVTSQTTGRTRGFSRLRPEGLCRSPLLFGPKTKSLRRSRAEARVLAPSTGMPGTQQPEGHRVRAEAASCYNAPSSCLHRSAGPAAPEGAAVATATEVAAAGLPALGSSKLDFCVRW
jgi:hypothetical protein